MINGDQISGILDWEFTQWGDRREDLGWFTSKCWRFGQDENIAGGIGSYKDFAKLTLRFPIFISLNLK